MPAIRTAVIWTLCVLVSIAGLPASAGCAVEEPGDAGAPAGCCGGPEDCHCGEPTHGSCGCEAPHRDQAPPAPKQTLAAPAARAPRADAISGPPAASPVELVKASRFARHVLPTRSRQEVLSNWRS